MARPIPEVRMLEPGERLQIDLDAWPSWKRERFYQNTIDAVKRWKKSRATEGKAATPVEEVQT